MNINESPTKSTLLDISEFTCVSKRAFECTIHNVASKLSKMVNVNGEFVTFLLQINLAIRTDFFSQALFCCTRHKGRIKQRVLVANVATNFRILVASTENLGALATVSGAISCPESCVMNVSMNVQIPENFICLFNKQTAKFRVSKKASG